ncbi:hypothetical protein [Streptomyces mirabilis]|uniref:hypothetical protein n=1 Tax=Streptomyces mirabilis TaxID=68239 RepID=UPI0033D7156E
MAQTFACGVLVGRADEAVHRGTGAFEQVTQEERTEETGGSGQQDMASSAPVPAV